MFVPPAVTVSFTSVKSCWHQPARLPHLPSTNQTWAEENWTALHCTSVGGRSLLSCVQWTETLSQIKTKFFFAQHRGNANAETERDCGRRLRRSRKWEHKGIGGNFSLFVSVLSVLWHCSLRRGAALLQALLWTPKGSRTDQSKECQHKSGWLLCQL